MKTLVTGGGGFIGSHMVDALIENGHDVRVLDNLQKTVHPHGKPNYIHPKAEFMYGDVRDKAAWQKALKDVTAIFHLAAYQDYLTDFSTFFHVNTVSTALLYEVLIESGQASDIKKVVVAASQAVMGEGRYKCPVCYEKNSHYIYPGIRLEDQLAAGKWNHVCPDCDRELVWMPSDETVVAPCNQYAISKHSQENIAIQLGRRYDIPSVVMRYSIVQGPRQSFFNAYSGAMRIFALSLLLGQAPTIFEDGLQVRDFVNIEDVVNANLLVLFDSRADYEVFNVGGGQAWTVNEFYDAMQMEVGKRLPASTGHYYRYGDTRHIFSDIRKLKALGWHPERSITDSIRDYWAYLQGGVKKDDILSYANRQMKKLKVIRKRNL